MLPRLPGSESYCVGIGEAFRYISICVYSDKGLVIEYSSTWLDTGTDNDKSRSTEGRISGSLDCNECHLGRGGTQVELSSTNDRKSDSQIMLSGIKDKAGPRLKSIAPMIRWVVHITICEVSRAS